MLKFKGFMKFQRFLSSKETLCFPNPSWTMVIPAAGFVKEKFPHKKPLPNAPRVGTILKEAASRKGRNLSHPFKLRSERGEEKGGERNSWEREEEVFV